MSNKILLHFFSSFEGSQIIIHLFIFKLTKVIKGICFIYFPFKNYGEVIEVIP
jgi:hypothetical protein